MSISITQRPQQTVNETIPQTSRWTSAWQPVIFKMRRIDYSIDLFYANPGSGGGLAVDVTGDITPDLEVGNDLYLYYPGLYDGNYEILDFYVSGSPEVTTIILDAPVSSATYDAAGWLNITQRDSYFVEIKVLEYSTGSPVEVTADYAQFRPDATGRITADIQQWLQPLIRAIDEFDYLQTSVGDPNLGQPFNIQVREYWTSNGYTDWTDLVDTNLHYIINGVKQAGQTYGQNFGEYVMFPPDTASPPTEGSRGKFLTMFESPVYFDGYPFDLAFIYSDEYDADGRTMQRVEQNVDVNGSELGITADLLLDYSGYVNRLTLRGGYTSDVAGVYVTLRTEGDGAYVDDGYVDPGYVDETGGVALSESLFVTMNTACVNNPIYLRWLNPVGGFDGWLFANGQDVQDTIGGEQTFEQYVEDIADQWAREQTLVKEATETITLGAAGLTKSQIRGMRHLLASPLVLRFMEYDSSSGVPVWQRVGVKPGTFLIERTDENRAEIQFTIESPQKYIQQQ